MRKSNRKFLVTMFAFAIALTIVPSALAQCGLQFKRVKPATWSPGNHSARFLQVSDGEDESSIVGMWHVVFTAKTSNGSAIPDTVIDNALVVWHSDKTEIMNSMRPPQDGNFCLGVWEQTGRRKYSLNHYAWFANAFPTNPPTEIGPPVGPTHITERVTLSSDGNHFTGTFTLDAFDTAGNVVQSFTGSLAGTRVTINTPPSDLF